MLRRQLLVEKLITEAKATVAVGRLRAWRLHRALVAPLIDAAWAYRHNMAAAVALYVVLAEQLGADFLTDDHRLADGPTFPTGVRVLRPLPSCRGSEDRPTGFRMVACSAGRLERGEPRLGVAPVDCQEVARIGSLPAMLSQPAKRRASSR